MNRLFSIRNLIVVLAWSFFSISCSSEDDTATLPAGEYPMTFSASVEQQLTRSTSENTWKSGDEIAMMISSEVKKYTSAADGKLSVASGVDPFYWQSQAETKTVQAWYPYTATTPNSWSVQSDQNAEGYQHSDLLYAPPTAISFSARNTTQLNFYHQTAKVVVNIINGDAATTAGDISGVKIGDANNITLSADYVAPSGNDTQGMWSNLSNGGIITPQEITPIGTYLKSYTVLLIPQNMTGKKFIAVTLSNGNTYYYTPNTGDTDLEGGKQYTYNITVKNGYMEVEALTGEQWANGGFQDVTDQDIKISYTATDLKPGDYYYSDGTWSDGGLRRVYMNGTGVGAGSVTPATGKTVVGIVFWTGDPTEGSHNNGTVFTDFGDPALKNEKSQCIHGLVVALQDASTDPMSWQTSSTDVGKWIIANTVYATIQSDAAANSAMNKIRGYNNTKGIRAYNISVGSSSDNLVIPVAAIDTWAIINSAPANSSGWYQPSTKELALLCGRDVNRIAQTLAGTGMRNIVNASLNNTGSPAGKIMPVSYWSNTESVGLGLVPFIDFKNGSLSSTGKEVKNRVRPILAF